jgi:DNA-binding beta-propeller fold protein YncE
VATARGRAYAVNTATHELAVLEPISQEVSRFPLSQEPAAIGADEDSGAVYVLSSRADVILQVDPTDGTELGRVLLANRSGTSGNRPSDLSSLRPRLILNSADETVYATLPEAGTLAAVTNGSFPLMAAGQIPWLDAPDQAVAHEIPSVIRATNPNIPTSDSTVEGL